MKKFPLISTVPSTVNALAKAAKEVAAGKLEFFQVTKFQNAVSVLKYELPEIKILDFGDKNTDAAACLKIIEDDPWLLFGGIIGIVDTRAQKNELEEQKNANFLFVVTRNEFKAHAVQIVNILMHQERFLYNRRSKIDTKEIEQGYFVCETDPFEVSFYTSLLCTYLYNTNRVDEMGRAAFQTAMMEFLLNAVEHGNCGITYSEKNAWLKDRKNILDLVAERLKNPANRKKKVYIKYEISPAKTRMTIRDEGKGFDWKKQLSGDFQPGLHGMGIKMSEQMVQNLRYNDAGNEVSFEIENQRNVANLTPRILKDQAVFPYKHMQIVCREGEESVNLFYICSGRFAVYVQNKLLTVLTPDDIFLGEMAFLLDNRRTATIVAIGEGRLIKIPKIKFIHLIEAYPHYGVFMAKLLATRLERQSKSAAILKIKLGQVLNGEHAQFLQKF